MIDLTIHPEPLERAVQRARERNIIIPTFKQQQNPDLIPAAIKAKLKNVGLWDINPLNLFRITWHNEPVASGGGFGEVVGLDAFHAGHGGVGLDADFEEKGQAQRRHDHQQDQQRHVSET